MSFSPKNLVIGFCFTLAAGFGAWAVFGGEQEETSVSSAEAVVIENDGVVDGRPQVTISSDIAIDIVIAPPNSHEEPVFQDAGSVPYPLHTDLDTGAESVTLTVVVFEAGTDNRLTDETFTWEREK